MKHRILSASGVVLALVLWSSAASGASGDLIWERVVAGNLGCPEPVAAAGLLVTWAQGLDRHERSAPGLRAYQAASGAPVWEAAGDRGLVPVEVLGPGVAAAGDRVYTAAQGPGSKFEFPDSAQLRAWDAGTGEPLWTFELDEAGFDYWLGPIAADSSALYVVGTRFGETESGVRFAGSELMVLALEGATGALLWEDRHRSAEGGDIGSGIAVGRGRVVAVTERGAGGAVSLRAYDATTGRQLWERATALGDASDLARYRDQLVSLGSARGRAHSVLQSHDLRTGEVLWRRRVKDVDLFSLAITRRTVVAFGRAEAGGERQPRLNAFDRVTGRRLWQKSESGSSAGHSVGYRGRVFTTGDREPDGGLALSAYRARSGALRWSRPPSAPDEGDAGCRLLVDDGRLLSTSARGTTATLRAFEP